MSISGASGPIAAPENSEDRANAAPGRMRRYSIRPFWSYSCSATPVSKGRPLHASAMSAATAVIASTTATGTAHDGADGNFSGNVSQRNYDPMVVDEQEEPRRCAGEHSDYEREQQQFGSGPSQLARVDSRLGLGCVSLLFVHEIPFDRRCTDAVHGALTSDRSVKLSPAAARKPSPDERAAAPAHDRRAGGGARDTGAAGGVPPRRPSRRRGASPRRRGSACRTGVPAKPAPPGAHRRAGGHRRMSRSGPTPVCVSSGSRGRSAPCLSWAVTVSGSCQRLGESEGNARRERGVVPARGHVGMTDRDRERLA